MRDRIIVALDVESAAEAIELTSRLAGPIGWVKVGMTLFYAEGPDVVRALRELGMRVFVDLKLHDIPHQVAGAARSLVRVGADMLTVHASGGSAMLSAAVDAVTDEATALGVARPSVAAVTVLTSLDSDALAELGVDRSAEQQVRALTSLAAAAGCDGVVCSPHETSAVRAVLGPDALVVTPGIRPAGTDAGDQARIATPSAALAAGASHLVIGRPITAAADPLAAVRTILAEGE